jgi:hypothetical protein
LQVSFLPSILSWHGSETNRSSRFAPPPIAFPSKRLGVVQRSSSKEEASGRIGGAQRELTRSCKRSRGGARKAWTKKPWKQQIEAGIDEERRGFYNKSEGKATGLPSSLRPGGISPRIRRKEKEKEKENLGTVSTLLL